MHEVALVTRMLDIVARDASTRGFTKVTRINLVVGKVSGACPPQLEFCFYAVTGNGSIDGVSMFKDTTLVIEEEDAVASCRDCGRAFSPVDLSSRLIFACPQCGSRDFALVSGKDVRVGWYEGEGDD